MRKSYENIDKRISEAKHFIKCINDNLGLDFTPAFLVHSFFSAIRGLVFTKRLLYLLSCSGYSALLSVF